MTDGQHVHSLLRLSCFVCLLQIIHTALAVSGIILQQYHYQIPTDPLPLNVTIQSHHATITYCAMHVHKVVDWAEFANRDEAGLTQVDALIS